MAPRADGRSIPRPAPAWHRAPRHVAAQPREAQRGVRVCRLRRGAVRLRDQVRVRHGLAELRQAGRPQRRERAGGFCLSSCGAPRCAAPAATATSGMSSPTAPARRRACATASTAPRSSSGRTTADAGPAGAPPERCTTPPPKSRAACFDEKLPGERPCPAGAAEADFWILLSKDYRHARFQPPPRPPLPPDGGAAADVHGPPRRRARGRVCLAAGRELAGGDARSRRARPQCSCLPGGRERVRRCRPGGYQGSAGRAVRRDEGPDQGGRFLRSRARRPIRVLHELRHRRPIRAAVPAPARRRPGGGPARRQQGGGGQGLLALKRSGPQPRPQAARLRRRRQGLRACRGAHPRSRHRARPAGGHPRHARLDRLGPGQPDVVLRAPRRPPAAPVRLSPPGGHAGRPGRPGLCGAGQRLLRHARRDPVGQIRRHPRSRPPDQRGLPRRLRQARERPARRGGTPARA